MLKLRGLAPLTILTLGSDHVISVIISEDEHRLRPGVATAMLATVV